MSRLEGGIAPNYTSLVNGDGKIIAHECGQCGHIERHEPGRKGDRMWVHLANHVVASVNASKHG